MNSVTISVITATYNSAKTLPSCLASLASQSYPALEHIIIDGASIDNTIEIAKGSGNRISKMISEPDDGIYDALNKGIATATGDVVGFLHSDDQLTHSRVLETIAEQFQDPGISAVYGDLVYVHQDDDARVIRNWKCKPFEPGDLSRGWMPPHPTLYVRRGWYERIAGFDTSFRIAADYLSVLRLFTSPDFKAIYIPDVLVKMRVGGVSNRSLKTIIQKSAEDWRALRDCGFPPQNAAVALLLKNFSKLPQLLQNATGANKWPVKR